MNEDERFMFHARIAGLIVNHYADERHLIEDNDPERDEKLRKNKEQCVNDLKKLNRYFFGAKMTWACAGCPMFDYFALNEAEKMANATDSGRR